MKRYTKLFNEELKGQAKQWYDSTKEKINSISNKKDKEGLLGWLDDWKKVVEYNNMSDAKKIAKNINDELKRLKK